MDEDLEQLRRLYAEDPVPDERSLGVLRARMAAAFAQETSGAKKRLTARRVTGLMPRRWAWAMSTAVALTVLLVVVLLPRNDRSELGMLVANYRAGQPTHTQPHFLDDMVTFGHLPEGFHLTSDFRSNKLTRPVQFDRTILFSEGAETLSIAIRQSSSFDGPFEPIGTLSNAIVTHTTIRGHPGEIVTVIPSGPTSPGGFPQPCGPARPAYASGNTLSQIQLTWIERPGVEFTVSGGGLSLDQLAQVANGIVYHRAIDECFADGHVVSTAGGCAPGTASSPPADDLAIPAGGTQIASGTVDSIPWAFSAAVAPNDTNTWYELAYRGQLVSGSCGSGGNAASSQLDLATALDGQRFATGAVPDLVTSVTATSNRGNTVSQPVLPIRLDGLAFFALSLGSFHGVCDDLCQGQVTLTFYHGGTRLATVTVPGDRSLGGFPIPAHIGRQP